MIDHGSKMIIEKLILKFTGLEIMNIGNPGMLPDHSIKRKVECRDKYGNAVMYETVIDLRYNEIKTKLICNTKKLSDLI